MKRFTTILFFFITINNLFSQIKINVWEKSTKTGKTINNKTKTKSLQKTFISSTPDGQEVIYDQILTEPIKVSTSSGKNFFYKPISYRSRKNFSVVTYSEVNGWTGFYENSVGDFWSMSTTKISKDKIKPDYSENLISESDIVIDNKKNLEIENSQVPPIARTWTNDQFYNPLIPINKTCLLYYEVSRTLYLKFPNSDAALNYVNNLFLGVKTLYSREGVYFKLNKIHLSDVPVSPLPYDFWAIADLDKFKNNILNNIPTNPESHFKQLLCFTNTGFGGNIRNGVAYIGHNNGDGFRYPINGGLPLDRLISVVDLKNNNQLDPLTGDPTDLLTFKEPIVISAHELGHNFGCQHTHWCGWKNDQNQMVGRLDSCDIAQTGFSNNPNCGNVNYTLWSKTPSVMSYCSFYSSNTIGLPYFVDGKNTGGQMTNGFTKYPRQVVRASLYSATQIPFDESTVFPTVTTNPNVSNPQNTSVTVSGEVLESGDSPIVNAGVCWSITNLEPTKEDEYKLAEMGTGFSIGAFDVNIINLLAGQTYHIRAFATNLAGTSYGDVITYTTGPSSLPSIEIDIDLNTMTNSSIFAIGKNINTGGGAITQKGFCWDIFPNNPDINSPNVLNMGTNSNDFSSTISNLSGSTTYNLKSYVINSAGIGYSDPKTFTTFSNVVTFKPLTTLAGSSRARFRTGILSDGGSQIIQKGFCWSINEGPEITDNVSLSGSVLEDYTYIAENLLPNTLYHVRAYLTNANGTFYSQEMTIMTRPATILTTLPASGITVTSFNAYMSLQRTETIPQSGILISPTNPEPTLTSYFKIYTLNPPNPPINEVAHIFNNLNPKTKYYVRSFVKDVFGLYYYGNVIEVKTFGSPDVLTLDLTYNPPSSAVGGGDVVSDNGFPVTSRGLVWTSFFDTPSLPSGTEMYASVDGTGTGTFNTNLTNLLPNKTYKVKAYAINSIGISYGELKTFTTQSLITTPTLATNNATFITSSSAISGGLISSTGGSPVISKGVCWSTSSGPTIDLPTKTNDGDGTFLGYSSSITNLEPLQTYHVRAYATNSVGTAYGNEITFTTTGPPYPTVKTLSGIATSSTSISVSSNVINQGNGPVTQRGVIWSVDQFDLTIDLDTKTSNGSGVGQFYSYIDNLSPNTTYYLRSYAINNFGVGYGDILTEITPQNSNGDCSISNITVSQESTLQGPKWFCRFSLNSNCQNYKVEVSKYASNPTNNPNLQPSSTYVINNSNPLIPLISDVNQGFVKLVMKPQPSPNTTLGSWFSLNIKCNGSCINNEVTKYYFYIPPP
jgi:hypothetical protein